MHIFRCYISFRIVCSELLVPFNGVPSLFEFDQIRLMLEAKGYIPVLWNPNTIVIPLDQVNTPNSEENWNLAITQPGLSN